jgi:tetratricopeptide (TPR) repeat protein
MSVEIKINKANKLYKQGKFEKSLMICERLLRTNPRFLNALKIQARSYKGLQNNDAALVVYKKISEMNSQDVNAWLELGNIYLTLKEFQMAINAYKKAIDLDISLATAWSNLATCQVNIGEYTLAEESYKNAITLDKSIPGFRINLALLHMKNAKFTEALDLFVSTLELNSTETRVYLNIFQIYMYLHRYQDALDIADMGIVSNSLSDTELCNILTGKAILFWLFYNHEEGKEALTLSDNIYKLQNRPNSMVNNMVVFHRYLTKLFNYRQENTDTTIYQYKPHEPVQEMFFISESHGFSPNNTIIHYQNTPHRIRSLFVMGAKIFHFINGTENKYRASLNMLFENLPRNSKVVLGFGEIDCRTNEGVLHHHMKSGQDICLIIDDMLNKYILLLEELAKEKALEIILYGVPVPHPDMTKLLDDDMKTKYYALVSYFNSTMKEICIKHNLSFLNVYGLTKENSHCKLSYYIDSTHLIPSTVPELFRELIEN